MTAADDAYDAAKKLIAEAAQTGATKLSFARPETRSLTRLPDELSNLTELTFLYLRGAQIADITALSALTALTILDLGNTLVDDLTALTTLTSLTSLKLRRTRVADVTPLATLTSLTSLDLGYTQVTDFTPLSTLTALTRLYLRKTSISDVISVSTLTALNHLDLRNTRVMDLRALRKLLKLSDGSKIAGLIFKNTAATRADPRIAEIAEIEDNATRARTLFEYLETWQPPVPVDSPTAPSFTVPDQGPITSRPDAPEGGNEDQEDLRQDLIRKSGLLVTAIGGSNELAVLADAAQHYQRQVAKPLPEIRLQRLYSAANTLRVAYEAQAQAVEQHRHSDQLPPRAAAALADLVETHALFFMGFPNAADIHAKMLAGLTGHRNRASVDLGEPIVHSLQGKVNVLDPEDQQALADDLAGAKGEGPSAEIAERRLVGRIQNMIFAVARKVYSTAKTIGQKVLERAIGDYIIDHKDLIAAFLHASQGTVKGWIDLLVQFLKTL